ncbi:MarR family transcriptional regulator [Dyella humicola]|uniref:MarR family transcriptional regulator n=1 Tax=Dyella humicola TaxID=2992126 RepID=UPI00224E30EE|nr:MarR family transcriptional regulator [Dyella humicola]
MNKHATNTGRRTNGRVALAPHPLEHVSEQTATETIYKVTEVARSLRCASQLMEKWVAMAAGASEHLTMSHWLVLVRLSSAPTCKQAELKCDTKISAPHLTRLIDDLTRQGLVRRHRSSSDRRQILLALTEQGRAAALGLLASLDHVSGPSQLNAIEDLGTSLEQFVSLAAGDGWFGGGV